MNSRRPMQVIFDPFGQYGPRIAQSQLLGGDPALSRADTVWAIRAGGNLGPTGFRRNRGSHSHHRAPPKVIRRLQSGDNSPSTEGT